MADTQRATKSGKAARDKEKTHRLFRRYKEGDVEAREKLVMSHMNLVRFLANKFKNRGSHSTTLSRWVILACSKRLTVLILVAALSSPYATPAIMGEIAPFSR